MMMLAGCATPGIPAREWVVAPEASISSVSESPGELQFARVFAPAIRTGYRWGEWGIGGMVEANLFRQKNLSSEPDHFAALLVGIDGELLSTNGWIRSRVGGGLAMVLKGSELDEPGRTGFYADIKPGGFRFVVGDAIRLIFDPLSLAVVVPDASGIPLVDVQYRSSLSVEFGL